MTSTQAGPHIELARELREHLSGEVRFDTYSRRLYSTDASMYEMEPVGVVAPRDEEDVMAAVRLAGQAGVSLLPRGGGTSLAGQTVNHGLVMDFSKYMSDLVELNTEEALGVGAAGDRAEPVAQPRGAPRAQLRPGPGDEQPGHDWGGHRQQLLRLALGGVRQRRWTTSWSWRWCWRMGRSRR